MNLDINPQKSFQFVKLVTNIVSRKVENSTESQTKKVKEAAEVLMPSPKEIRNASVKSNIVIQSKITPQSRFIDIFV